MSAAAAFSGGFALLELLMHAWLAAALPALVLVHVVSAFAFALVHGPSVFALWSIRGERDPARLAALLDLSRRANGASWSTFMVLGLSGLALAFAEHTWREPWVWGSAVVLVLLTLSMSFLGAQPFNHMRGALGLEWFTGKGVEPATGVVDLAALEKAHAMVRVRGPWVTAVGLVGLALLVWLMVARPALA